MALETARGVVASRIESRVSRVSAVTRVGTRQGSLPADIKTSASAGSLQRPVPRIAKVRDRGKRVLAFAF